MAVTVPNALALANIADGAAIVASDHRNNYAAVQVGVNGLVAMFAAAPTKGDLLVSTGGGNFDKLAVGANGRTIAADSSQATGLRYAGPAYRKLTAKQVVNTVVETDLLNGEITIAAGDIGVNGKLRLTIEGDWVNNTGGAQGVPRFKVKLGATTLIDTNSPGAFFSTSANRWGWKAVIEIGNLGAANSQWGSLAFIGTLPNGVGAGATNFSAGEGNTLLQSISGGVGLMQAMGSGAAAVDTTLAQVLAFTVINGVANANYDVTLKHALVEIL